MAELLELFSLLDEEDEESEEADEEEDDTPFWSSAFIPSLIGSVCSSSSRSFSFSSDSRESSILESDFPGLSPLPRDISHNSPSSPLIDTNIETLVSPDAVRDFLSLGETRERSFEHCIVVGSQVSSAEPRIEEFGSESDLSEHGEAEDGTFGSPLFTVGPIDSSASSGSSGLRIAEFGYDSVSSVEAEEGTLGNRSLAGSRVASAELRGFRIPVFESESDFSEFHEHISVSDNYNSGGAPDNVSGDREIPSGWDFGPIDEERMGSSEDFEWEEVNDRLDVRAAFNMMVSYESDETLDGRGDVVDVQLGAEEDGLEVEEDDSDTMSQYGPLLFNPNDLDDFEGQEVVITGSFPAAKLVVEHLPSVILTEEYVLNHKSLCAVCKDAFLVEERTKLLPCSHLYHSGCILPWLGIRNTCPVCRYELPTDDLEYERSKARARAGSAAAAGNSS